MLDPVTIAIVLMMLGLACFVLEVFLPSGGLLSFVAVALLVAAVVFAFRRSTETGIGFVVLSVIAVPAAVALAFKYWPHTPMGKAFLGEVASEEEAAPEEPRRTLVGKTGVAHSKMLPAGAVKIDGRLVDAVARGQAIEPGQTVVVEEVRGNRVMVRLAHEDETPASPDQAEELLSRPIEDLGLDSIDDPLA